METSNIVALAAVALTATGGAVTTLIGIWKNGKSAGRSEAAAERVERAVALVQEHAVTLAEHTKDIEHLKDSTTTMSRKQSEFAQTLGKTRDLAIKTASHHDLSAEVGE